MPSAWAWVDEADDLDGRHCSGLAECERAKRRAASSHEEPRRAGEGASPSGRARARSRAVASRGRASAILTSVRPPTRPTSQPRHALWPAHRGIGCSVDGLLEPRRRSRRVARAASAADAADVPHERKSTRRGRSAHGGRSQMSAATARERRSGRRKKRGARFVLERRGSLWRRQGPQAGKGREGERRPLKGDAGAEPGRAKRPFPSAGFSPPAPRPPPLVHSSTLPASTAATLSAPAYPPRKPATAMPVRPRSPSSSSSRLGCGAVIGPRSLTYRLRTSPCLSCSPAPSSRESALPVPPRAERIQRISPAEPSAARRRAGSQR